MVTGVDVGALAAVGEDVGAELDARLVVLEEGSRSGLRKPEVGEEGAHLKRSTCGVVCRVVLQISSTGAEMHALSSCAHELVAMRNQLKELGYDMSTPSVLSGDNTASIMAAKNPGQHRSALRHLELHAFAVRDLVREQQVELLWCSTEENPADLLTKAVASKVKFDKFSKWIMGYVDESVLAFMLQCRRRVVTGSDL